MSSQMQTPLPEGIQKDKVARLIKWLLSVEADNDKTGQSTDGEMIQKIGKQIRGEVKCL